MRTLPVARQIEEPAKLLAVPVGDAAQQTGTIRRWNRNISRTLVIHIAGSNHRCRRIIRQAGRRYRIGGTVGRADRTRGTGAVNGIVQRAWRCNTLRPVAGEDDAPVF